LIRPLDYKYLIYGAALAAVQAAGAIAGPSGDIPDRIESRESRVKQGDSIIILTRESPGGRPPSLRGDDAERLTASTARGPGVSEIFAGADQPVAANSSAGPSAGRGMISGGAWPFPSRNRRPADGRPDPWFGRDKAQHFVVSFLMTGAVSYAAARRGDCGRRQARAWGPGVTLSLGALKELRDLRHPGSQASFRDLAADAAGAAFGTLLLSWW
jgi:putative lipoprotein